MLKQIRKMFLDVKGKYFLTKKSKENTHELLYFEQVFWKEDAFEGKVEFELIFDGFHHVYHFSSILFINIIYHKISRPFFTAGTIPSVMHSTPCSGLRLCKSKVRFL